MSTDDKPSVANLLPCPFCGAPPIFTERTEDKLYSTTGRIWFIACFCGGHSARAHQFGHTVVEVVEKWNQRSNPSAEREISSTERAQSDPNGVELRGRQPHEGASTQAPHAQAGGRVEAPAKHSIDCARNWEQERNIGQPESYRCTCGAAPAPRSHVATMRAALQKIADDWPRSTNEGAQKWAREALAAAPQSATRPNECQHFSLSATAVQNLADWMNDGDGGWQEVTLHVDGEGQLSVSITEYPEEGAMPLATAERTTP